MKIRISPILLSLSLLTACSTHSPDTVQQLNALTVPVVTPDTTPAQTATLLPLHQQNKQKISTLTASLKQKYLQRSTRKDIFDTHSETARVYAALTKLEQFSYLNDNYLKEKNEQGLQEISMTLQSVS
ncbi:hypothetical protein NNO04_16550 [Citrobacter sp. Awk 4]|uniref:hypothetical protein n=1 Tax=Citrobacter sp. Awk 4 TaxID=2963955 RepID=UPI002303D6C2|nr:hypothetical protein [Citrobacter sp. Awk 4]MDA8480308.1 hypothetical protein [Citrobacter sp. Awk 4]